MADESTARPNRWTGPPSTWRSYTREERGVAASLDTIRSQDLSIHLYNAYAIKCRVRRADAKGKGKAQSSKNESDFVPPDVWTAWPMPADEVPREPYLPNVGGKGAWRMDEDVRPSARLEEALLATTTRIARERWRARRWEWRGSKMEVNVKEEERPDEEVVERSTVSENEDEDEDIVAGRPMFSSQAYGLLDNNDSSDGDQKRDSEDDAEIERRPVPLADDDQARRLLLPPIRHIISKADDLLSGLQKAREAYAGNWNKSKGDTTTSGEETDTAAETSRVRSKKPGRSKRARTSSVDSSASMVSTTSAASRGRRKPKMKRLKLRDWSDVLGMAALTGWDPGVVQRAAARCSSLFGQEMLFRTFEEGEGGEKSYFTEELASGKDPADSSVAESDEEVKLTPVVEEPLRIPGKKVQETEPDALVGQDSAIRCPVTICPGNQMVYARAKNMYDHVRAYHPEVDIKELKKLESRRRGDRRGRWDRRSRQRSSSQTVGSSP